MGPRASRACRPSVRAGFNDDRDSHVALDEASLQRPEPLAPKSAVMVAQETSDSTGISQAIVSANDASTYHGRTSTLFEETPQHRTLGIERPPLTDEWIEKGLVAEASRQRNSFSFLFVVFPRLIIEQVNWSSSIIAPGYSNSMR